MNKKAIMNGIVSIAAANNIAACNPVNTPDLKCDQELIQKSEKRLSKQKGRIHNEIKIIVQPGVKVLISPEGSKVFLSPEGSRGVVENRSVYSSIHEGSRIASIEGSRLSSATNMYGSFRGNSSIAHMYNSLHEGSKIISMEGSRLGSMEGSRLNSMEGSRL